jgi:hypothetical protein
MSADAKTIRKMKRISPAPFSNLGNVATTKRSKVAPNLKDQCNCRRNRRAEKNWLSKSEKLLNNFEKE